MNEVEWKSFAPVVHQGYLVHATPRECAIGVVAESRRKFIEKQSVWILPIPEFRSTWDILTLREGLQRLYPLQARGRPYRYVVLPTVTADWTVVLYNHFSDQTPEFMSGLATQVNATVIYYLDHMHSLKPLSSKRWIGHFGGTSLWFFEPHNNFMNPDRALSCVREDSGWKFDQHGTPKPFENTNCYTASKVRDRFDSALLRLYLNAIGLRPFDPAFFQISLEAPGAFIQRMDGPTPGDEIQLLDDRFIREEWYAELGLDPSDFKPVRRKIP